MYDYMFKGKRIDNGKVIYGDRICSYYKQGDVCIGRFGLEAGVAQVELGSECLWTNKTDRNDEEIFENDILFNAEEAMRYKVEYDEDAAAFRLIDDYGYEYAFDEVDMNDFEVIGNTKFGGVKDE